jgi:hypothetical protein
MSQYILSLLIYVVDNTNQFLINSEIQVYDREEWKKLLRTARNRRILHMPME